MAVTLRYWNFGKRAFARREGGNPLAAARTTVDLATRGANFTGAGTLREAFAWGEGSIAEILIPGP